MAAHLAEYTEIPCLKSFRLVEIKSMKLQICINFYADILQYYCTNILSSLRLKCNN